LLQDVDITLELKGKFLRLIDASKNSELVSQRLNVVRQWSVGPGTNRSTFISNDVYLSFLYELWLV